MEQLPHYGLFKVNLKLIDISDTKVKNKAGYKPAIKIGLGDLIINNEIHLVDKFYDTFFIKYTQPNSIQYLSYQEYTSCMNKIKVCKFKKITNKINTNNRNNTNSLNKNNNNLLLNNLDKALYFNFHFVKPKRNIISIKNEKVIVVELEPKDIINPILIQQSKLLLY